MTGGMLELSEDESGEELLPEESDYRAIPELDRYDADMLDDRPRAQSSRRELSARQRAEEVMSARDAQQRRGIVGRGGEHGAHAGGNAASGRGPRALEQVKANRTSNLELARLGAALKCPDAVVAKAEGYLRKAYTGARCLSNGTQLASLPAACLEIAARVCKKPVARDALLRKAGVHEKDVPNYTRALAHCHCLLGIRREVSVAELCTEFKCNGIKASIRQTLEAFKRQFWSSLPENRRQDADFGRPVFAIVALYMTAEKNTHIVKLPAKNELMKAGDVPADEFKRIYDQMKSLAAEAAQARAAPVQPAAAAAAAAPTQRIAAAAMAAPGVSAKDEDAHDEFQALLLEQDRQAAALLEQDEAAADAAARADFAAAPGSSASSSTAAPPPHAGQVLGSSAPLSADQAAAAAAAPVFGAKTEGSAESADRPAAAAKEEALRNGVAGFGNIVVRDKEGPEKDRHAGAMEVDGTAPAKGRDEMECRGGGDAEGRGAKTDKVAKDATTPARGDSHAGANSRNTLSGSSTSTVRKVNARRPMPSAADRLSSLCNIGVKRPAPPAEAVEGAKPRAGGAAPQSCTLVASDGKAKSGNNKKQRKEEAEAEQQRKREERAAEYAKWRAVQVAELESAKSAATAARSDSSTATAAVDAAPAAPTASEADPQTSSGAGAAPCAQDAAAPPAEQAAGAHEGRGPSSQRIAAGSVAPAPGGAKQSSLLAFIRPKPAAQQHAEDTAHAGVEAGGDRTGDQSSGGGGDMRERMARAAEARERQHRQEVLTAQVQGCDASDVAC